MTNATTTKTVTVVNKAATAIAKITGEAQKVIAQLTTLTDTSAELAFSIEEASGRLAAIEVQIKDDLRNAKADLAIKVKENSAIVLQGLLKADKLAYITDAELSEIVRTLAEAQDNNDAEVGKAAGMAKSKAEADAKVVLAEANSAAAINAAETKAQVTALTQKAAFLESTIVTLEKNAEAERAARVSIAATSQAPVVNTYSGK